MKGSGESSTKIEAIILGNEFPDDHQLWIDACREYSDQINYRIVDLTLGSWLEDIQKQEFDILLIKPGGVSAQNKQMYDERVYILNKVKGYPVFPSLDELLIYENKKYLSYWLKANRIPHPVTDVFYDYEEAVRYIGRISYPVVVKTGIGASGSGILILRNKNQILKYLKLAFRGKGIGRRSGPNIRKGDLFSRAIRYLINPSEIAGKLKLYRLRAHEKQKGFVIIQEYVPHNYEWRVVRIGDSFFAHKKLVNEDKASGSLLKNYDNPPFGLLTFVKEITDQHDFFSLAVDIFETPRGFLVNEMQCIFGQSDPFQMMVDGKPGRYLFKESKWVFEPGDFTHNQCYNLRVKWVISKLR